MANDRYSRTAIRRKARKPRHTRSRTPMVISIFVIVLVFGVGIFLAIQQRKADANTAPRAATTPGSGDHWHAFLGVNVCGTWIDNAPQFEPIAGNSKRNAGIHSHGDGLIHIHPFLSDEAGKNATVGKFIKYGGWSLSETSMTLWDGVTHKNGQDCPAGSNYSALTATTTTTAAPGASTTEPASTSTTATTVAPPTSAAPAYIVWTVNGKPKTGNPAAFRPKNGDIIAIGFLPKGVALTEPPNAKSALTNITDLTPAQAATTTIVSAVAGITVPPNAPDSSTPAP